jgi:hypothetical protein
MERYPALAVRWTDERGRKARLRERKKKGVTGGTDLEAREGK